MVDALEGLIEAMFVVTRWIVAMTPLAVFGIMTWLIASHDRETLLDLRKLVEVLFLVSSRCGVFWGPCSAAFVSVHDNQSWRGGAPAARVHNALFGTHRLNGAALYQALAALFLADIYGLPITGTLVLTLVATTLVASEGLAISRLQASWPWPL